MPIPLSPAYQDAPSSQRPHSLSAGLAQVERIRASTAMLEDFSRHYSSSVSASTYRHSAELGASSATAPRVAAGTAVPTSPRGSATRSPPHPEGSYYDSGDYSLASRVAAHAMSLGDSRSAAARFRPTGAETRYYTRAVLRGSPGSKRRRHRHGARGNSEQVDLELSHLSEAAREAWLDHLASTDVTVLRMGDRSDRYVATVSGAPPPTLSPRESQGRDSGSAPGAGLGAGRGGSPAGKPRRKKLSERVGEMDHGGGGGGSPGRGGASALDGSDGDARAQHDRREELQRPLAEDGGPAGKVRPLSWLLHIIDEVYEQRLRLFGVEVESSAAEFEPFQQFAFRHLAERFGLENLVQENAADLVCTVAEHRAERPDVRTFSDFLTGTYDAVDLLFYLFARQKAIEEAVEEEEERPAQYLIDAGMPVPKNRYRRLVLPGNVVVYVTRLITADLPEETARECIEAINDAVEAGNPSITAERVCLYSYLAVILTVWNRRNVEIRDSLAGIF